VTRPEALLLNIGAGEPVRGAHFSLAMRARAAALLAGLIVTDFRPSKANRGVSYYLTLSDQAKRSWLVRVSNHRRPDRAVVPHVDLVTRDGLLGGDWLCDAIQGIAAGLVEWFDYSETNKPVKARISRRIAKSRGMDAATLRIRKRFVQ
jgi:hypothetical protein